MIYKTRRKEPIDFKFDYNRERYIKEYSKDKKKGLIDVLKGIINRIKRREYHV